MTAVVLTFTGDTDSLTTNQRERDTIAAARAAGYAIASVDRIPSSTPRAISSSQARAILRGRPADAIAFHNGQAVQIVRTLQ